MPSNPPLSTDKPLSQSKKAQALVIALVNLNLIFFLTPVMGLPLALATQMVTAVLFLVGIYVGVQGGIEMIQSNKMDYTRTETVSETISKNYVMEYPKSA
jgi:predicted RND superfamily exporter protein